MSVRHHETAVVQPDAAEAVAEILAIGIVRLHMRDALRPETATEPQESGLALCAECCPDRATG